MVYFTKLILRNALRHKLRTGLTVLGIIVAIVAFGLLRTVVGAWYAGADAATGSARLVTRNAISLVFPLPIHYREKIRHIPGVEAVGYANWFAGVYINERNFFPQFAVGPEDYLDLFPELVLSAEARSAFLHDRKACIAGRKLAQEYGWKIGDVIPLRGTIYPGEWNFVLRAIYQGADKKTDETQFIFHWDYLNEALKRTMPNRADHVGLYIVGLKDPDRAAEVSREIDHTFKNSLAETLTETEKAFQLGFIAMTEAIVLAIQIVSFVVIVIIMAVMANTMAMTARERKAEYATLKILGFGPHYIVVLIMGESLAIALGGGVIGIMLTYPVANLFAGLVGTLFPVFNVAPETVLMAIAAAFLVGVAAALIPAWRAVTVPIAEGLRSPG
jgi:putative ABC transport system permease protein